MVKNEIFVHTNQGSYVGGDIIYGTVYLRIHQPIVSYGMIIEIVGYEKAEWEYQDSEFYDEDGQQKSRTVIREHKDHHSFFKDSFKLIEYPGGFPTGQFSYPFQYRLPESLPGVFTKKRKSGLKMKAKVEYKIKCIVDLPGKHDLKCKQHLTVHEKLNKVIEAKHVIKEQVVRTLCCIPRGPVKCDSWMDKTSYAAGETSNIYVKVNNDSNVDVNHFVVKLIREITLKAHGHYRTFKEVVAQQKYPGTPSHTFKESSIPLPLYSKKGHVIQPGTKGTLVQCKYDIMIEMSIPWAPDLEIFNPITIYAPQNLMWTQWAAPAWASSAQVQAVNPKLAIPSDVYANLQRNPVQHQQQQQQSFSPVLSPVQVHSSEPLVHSEKMPLLMSM